MPLRDANPSPPFDVLRVSHVELGVSDLERSAAFYVGALGFVETARDEGALYLRGLEDRGHHCLVLRASNPGTCLRLGFRVRSDQDLDLALRLLPGARLRRRASTAPTGQGRTLEVRDPFGVPLAFYASQRPVERKLQDYGAYHGAAPQRIDHVNAFAADLQATHDFYAGDLGFRTSEYTDTDEAEPRLWAVWMHRKGNVHDLALTNGVGPAAASRRRVGAGRTRHPARVRRARHQRLACRRSSVVRAGTASPTRSSCTCAIPDGHRVELFTGDYRTMDPDFEPVGWKMDDPAAPDPLGASRPEGVVRGGQPVRGRRPPRPRHAAPADGRAMSATSTTARTFQGTSVPRPPWPRRAHATKEEVP
jgi:catechol 2,3-dioxygenase